MSFEMPPSTDKLKGEKKEAHTYFLLSDVYSLFCSFLLFSPLFLSSSIFFWYCYVNKDL